MLLDRANGRTADNAGQTALIWVAADGRTEAAAMLLGRGADVNATENDDQTAVLFAAANGHRETAAMLRQNALPWRGVQLLAMRFVARQRVCEVLLCLGRSPAGRHPQDSARCKL